MNAGFAAVAASGVATTWRYECWLALGKQAKGKTDPEAAKTSGHGFLSSRPEGANRAKALVMDDGIWPAIAARSFRAIAARTREPPR